MPRPRLVDRTGRFLVPIVYRLRTADGDPVDVARGDGIPNCSHCGQPVPLRPEPDVATGSGEFIVPVKQDTREQVRYTFEGISWDAQDGGGPGKTLTIETVRGTLKQGDYSLLGYESRVSVERKSLEDAYSTIGQGRDRFERELERLASYEFAAVVIEATWPEICADPPGHTRLAPKTVFRSIVAWSVRYPRVHWFPAGPRRLAEITTFRLLERFLREELTRGKDANDAGQNAGHSAGKDATS